jgi:hypothetical protein
MTGPEAIIMILAAAPFWAGGLVLWWALNRSRRRANASSPSVPAGWHADPTGRFELRYWDGVRWTDRVSTGGLTSDDPVR